jgi:hypothetical protein
MPPGSLGLLGLGRVSSYFDCLSATLICPDASMALCYADYDSMTIAWALCALFALYR